MSSNHVSPQSAATRQRILFVVAVVAVVTAWRERAFARNRARYAATQAPQPNP
ncbi:MAG TPA: hypothetical protein PLS46_12860 [Microthrixaceae bacterium]|jgi:hypothetical protein|nr:hypothetical protein [Microthrixaceae bacterium]